MNIKIETTFTQKQKLQFVVRDETIPSVFVKFVMSPEKMKMLLAWSGTYIVSNDSVQINKNVGIFDGKYYNISSEISELLANGSLIQGQCIDMIMDGIMLSIKQNKKEDKERAKKSELRENPAKAKKRAENQANEEKIAAEKAAWLNEFGSDRLKEGIRQGYECNRLYAAEKGAHMLGEGYILDYKYEISTGARFCPSMHALDEVNLLKEKEIDAGIVWLPYGFTEIKDDSEFPIEAVRLDIPGIQGYWYKEI